MRDDFSGRRWTRIFRPEPRREIEEELAFHLEQRVREYMERGMDAAAARAAAQQRLGDLQRVRSECTDLLTAERRSAARRDWLKFSWLDFRLGLRMLRKYPGLTIVGGAAMAFAIAIAAVGFEFLMQITRPQVPLPDGDRIVAIRMWDAEAGGLESRTLFDFITWRDDLRSVRDPGVFRTAERDLGTDGRGVVVTVAEMTAAGFRVARVTPLLGRTLTEEDERPGASAVVVVGERVWRTQFDADPNAIGRVVHVGSEPRVVVGVMPEEFAFPLHHDAWIPFPLPLNAAGYRSREGPAIRIFGQLAAGFTLEQARAELGAAGARARQDHPQTHKHLQPQVVPYTDVHHEPDALFLAYFGNSFGVLLLLLIYANVALLMFGRAAARESEMIVRTALGASRGRILTQLFAEALVLGAVAAVIGVAFARLAMGWGFQLIELNRVQLPFWYHASLSPVTLCYAVGLTLLAALVAGVLPGLKVTRGVGAQLRAATAGAGGLRFGRGWTVIIVAQVAFMVAFFPLLITLAVQTARARAVELGVAATEYLTVRLVRDETPSRGAADAERSFATMSLDLKRRVLVEPGVTAVTFAQDLPGDNHAEPAIEVEDVPTLLSSGVRPRAQRATVDLDFFAAMDVPIVTGRVFHAADVGSDARVVVVNQSFVRDVLGGRNPIGRRLRYIQSTRNAAGQLAEGAGPWQEIVGVVRDVAMSVNPNAGKAGVYHPLSLDDAATVDMAVRVQGDPIAFAPQLRSLGAAVDPALRLRNMQSLEELARDYLNAMTLVFRMMIGVGAVALLLSLAGIYSIMAFTVTRRTREIGIRVALGSSRMRVIAAVFSRAFVQVGLGVAIGVGIFLTYSVVGLSAARPFRWSHNLALVAAYATFMAGVCLLACVVPARRALVVQPTEALRADA